jgi:Ribbon-helix-helix protein, copG family
MKLIQTRVPEAEYDLLRRKAKAEGKTMQEWIRAAIRNRLLPDEVDSADPIFGAFPLVRGKGAKVDVAERHDEFLYGPLR